MQALAGTAFQVRSEATAVSIELPLQLSSLHASFLHASTSVVSYVWALKRRTARPGQAGLRSGIIGLVKQRMRSCSRLFLSFLDD